MKFSPKIRTLALFTAAMLSLAGCATDDDISQTDPNLALTPGETLISLSDNAVLVEGEPVSQSSTVSVYEGADIIYYEAGRGEGYGEGTTADEHTAQEADAHTVLTITSPGTYRATGTLSQGQLVVDLGQEARENPEARVTLILDDVDLTCTVAPAILVKNAYECGSAQIETATHQVDTGDAGLPLCWPTTVKTWSQARMWPKSTSPAPPTNSTSMMRPSSRLSPSTSTGSRLATAS